MDKVKQYAKGDIRVIWKPDLCIHSAKCVHALPEVFDPKARPWINVDGADRDAIIEAVNRCPSGALSIQYDQTTAAPTPLAENATKVEIIENGPLMVHGDLTVCDPVGNETSKTRVTAFCRCGASENKPYCDGRHRKIGFEG